MFSKKAPDTNKPKTLIVFKKKYESTVMANLGDTPIAGRTSDKEKVYLTLGCSKRHANLENVKKYLIGKPSGV